MAQIRYRTLSFVILALPLDLPWMRSPFPGVRPMVLDILVTIPATIRDIKRVVGAAGAPFLLVMLLGREAGAVRKANLASPSGPIAHEVARRLWYVFFAFWRARFRYSFRLRTFRHRR